MRRIHMQAFVFVHVMQMMPFNCCSSSSPCGLTPASCCWAVPKTHPHHSQLFSPFKFNNIAFPLTTYRNPRTLRCHVQTVCSLPAPNLVNFLGRTLWGPGLPPGFLVGAVRNAWTASWTVMMNQLAPSDGQGAYQRPGSKFRNRPRSPVSSSESGRYHLYVSLTCPWAHRAIIVHVLKGLEAAVPLSIAVPGNSGMWEFRPQRASHNYPEGPLRATLDMANQCQRLKDVYGLRKGGYDGRATVPMLWDSEQKEVVNNESADIIQILNSEFNQLARNAELDLAPAYLMPEIEKWNSIVYPNINNGVYRCGFAHGQGAYNSAVEIVFSTLDMLEEHLSSFRYLCGDHFTLADVRLFTTLFRFDPVYNVLFKCSKHKLVEYPNLYGYMRDIYQIPGIAMTCDLEAIMVGYYQVLFPLNPGGIMPIIPSVSERDSLLKHHNRELISTCAPI